MAVRKLEKRAAESIFNDCYNCGTEIIDKSQRVCPNCGFILNPNDHIEWKKSWLGFLCFLCSIPFFIMLIFYLSS